MGTGIVFWAKWKYGIATGSIVGALVVAFFWPTEERAVALQIAISFGFLGVTLVYAFETSRMADATEHMVRDAAARADREVVRGVSQRLLDVGPVLDELHRTCRDVMGTGVPRGAKRPTPVTSRGVV